MVYVQFVAKFLLRIVHFLDFAHLPVYKIKVKSESALFVTELRETTGELGAIGRAVSTLTGLGWTVDKVQRVITNVTYLGHSLN